MVKPRRVEALADVDGEAGSFNEFSLRDRLQATLQFLKSHSQSGASPQPVASGLEPLLSFHNDNAVHERLAEGVANLADRHARGIDDLVDRERAVRCRQGGQIGVFVSGG